MRLASDVSGRLAEARGPARSICRGARRADPDAAGVRAAGYAGALPMFKPSAPCRSRAVRPAARVRRRSSCHWSPASLRIVPIRGYVSREFLRVMGTRVIAGRDFDEKDSVGQQPVILINETVARSGVLGKEPIGHLVYTIGPKPWQVIGIVEDTRDLGLELEPNPQVFMNFSQLPGALGPDGIEQPSLRCSIRWRRGFARLSSPTSAAFCERWTRTRCWTTSRRWNSSCRIPSPAAACTRSFSAVSPDAHWCLPP